MELKVCVSGEAGLYLPTVNNTNTEYSHSPTLQIRACGWIAMAMAIRVFLILLLSLSSTHLSYSLYEDQVGLMDWWVQLLLFIHTVKGFSITECSLNTCGYSIFFRSIPPTQFVLIRFHLIYNLKLVDVVTTCSLI